MPAHWQVGNAWERAGSDVAGCTMKHDRLLKTASARMRATDESRRFGQSAPLSGGPRTGNRTRISGTSSRQAFARGDAGAMTSELPLTRSGRATQVGTRHAVAAGHHLAAEAAIDVLEAGGNAVDAGAAAGLVIGVVEVSLVNVAGVAPIMIRMAERGEIVTIDGLGTWPRAASGAYFRKTFDGAIPDGLPRAVMPAAVDAWLTALERYGTMSFADVAEAAVRAAREGFPAYPLMVLQIAEQQETIGAMPDNAAVFMPQGRPPKVGETLVQADLAGTLQFLADEDKTGGKRSRVCRASEGARGVLQGRYRPRHRGVPPRQRWADHAPGPRRLPRQRRGAVLDPGRRYRGPFVRALEPGADAASNPQHPGRHRHQADAPRRHAGLHPHRHRGHQAGGCRPRGLLRRSQVRRRTDGDAAREGLRGPAPRDDPRRRGLARHAAGGRDRGPGGGRGDPGRGGGGGRRALGYVLPMRRRQVGQRVLGDPERRRRDLADDPRDRADALDPGIAVMDRPPITRLRSRPESGRG